ncbi:hypothetical protein SAMN00790413_01981 [Deinococcus hopiensis KR-140]|uniref:Uncharacterized protein n=2 Tax=Deinococcus TaxID=1298 RepID=A0A1W1VJ95_9DEIO|nr:hypothetical protein SAMN00790413_01981 [Deinococcus hopiensis KR-140]
MLALCLLPRAPGVEVRVAVGALALPLAAYHLLLSAVLLFFVIFQIPRLPLPKAW